MLNITAFSLIHLDGTAYAALVSQCGMSPRNVKSRPYVDSQGHHIAGDSEARWSHQQPAEQMQTVVEFVVTGEQSKRVVTALQEGGWEVLVDGAPVSESIEKIVPRASEAVAPPVDEKAGIRLLEKKPLEN